MKFSNKVVLVTGASRGIGAAIATAFAAEGATVIVNYRERAADAAATVAACQSGGGDALALAADVTDRAAVAGMVATIDREVGPVDVLVNNALPAYSFDPRRRRAFEQLDWPAYQAQFDGAVGAAFQVSQAVLPHFRRRAGGSIINIVSDLVERPLIAFHDYSTAKAGLVAFSRNLATELGPLGVRVNCVAPGLVYPTSASETAPASYRESLIATTPLRRLARPADVAGPALFLASDWSGFMTGQVLFVDGGLVG